MSDALARVHALLARDPAPLSAGIEIVEASEGGVELAMTVRPDMVNSAGVAHGGWIFILADTAFAYAMTTAAPGALTAGAEIRFRRPAYAGQRLRAVARVERISGRDILAHADVFTTSPEPIAVFTGTGRVPRSATGATS